jgi:uncharacterized membrane protein
MYGTLTSSTNTFPKMGNLSLYVKRVFLVSSCKSFLFFNYSKLFHFDVKIKYFAYC